MLLVTLLIGSFIFAQKKDYGQKNGYDWNNDFTKQAEIMLRDFHWANKQESIDAEVNSLKINYLIGIYDLATRIPAECYIKIKDGQGKYKYYDIGNSFPYLSGTSPSQMSKALDNFYSDYRNMNIFILDAIHICQMEINGASKDDIDWQTRYYRTDKEGKEKMKQEKYHSTNK